MRVLDGLVHSDFITPGVMAKISIVLAGYYLLQEGVDLLGDQQSRCNRYFGLVADCANYGECGYAEIDSLGRDCELDIMERLGKEAAFGFSVFHQRVLEKLRDPC